MIGVVPVCNGCTNCTCGKVLQTLGVSNEVIEQLEDTRGGISGDIHE